MGTFGTPSSYNNTGALGSATNPTTAQGLSRDRENQKAVLELPGTQEWVEKTITDGVIIPTSAEIVVLPEGGASTDSLTTIALTSDGTTTLHEGMLIRLKAANSNTITVVHGTGTNNISTIDGNNVILDTSWYLELKLIGGLWVQQETSAYKTANEAKASAATAQTLASGAYILSGTSSTSSSVAAKVVDLSGYVLRTGSRVSVTFSNTNTVADALTINVNGTGAMPVYNQTGIVSTSNTALFAANQPIEFRYDGTGWVFYDAAKVTTSFATSSTAAGTADKVATCAGFALSNPARVFVTFSNANTVSGALTLNVNGTGAIAIYNQFGAVSSTNPAMFPANQPIEFVYDGAHWVYHNFAAESSLSASPSTRFASISMPSSGGTISPPANGWLFFKGAASTSGQILQLEGPVLATQSIFSSGAGNVLTCPPLKTKKDAPTKVSYSSGMTSLSLFLCYDEGVY